MVVAHTREDGVDSFLQERNLIPSYALAIRILDEFIPYERRYTSHVDTLAGFPSVDIVIEVDAKIDPMLNAADAAFEAWKAQANPVAFKHIHLLFTFLYPEKNIDFANDPFIFNKPGVN